MVPWKNVPRLPFELAVFPQSWYKLLRLHVVSYALPALIAVGIAIENSNPSKGTQGLLRHACRNAVLTKLSKLQPQHGGFLDATPLTSFVAMSLIPVFGADQSVACKCLDFIRQSQRSDGSWPIDTNLSVWMTSNAVSALNAAGRIDSINTNITCQWLFDRQYTAIHPFTGAAPGGWGWTHLPGGVPDADDTSGAILALDRLGSQSGSLDKGAKWLLQLQNSDGGWPTFCRGWGKLPFDKSSPDITAHAIRALRSAGSSRDAETAIRRGYEYLERQQRPDGSWVPLWFGNQLTPDQENPVFGTARVIPALISSQARSRNAKKGVEYILNVQNEDGGWGGGFGVSSSIEETALAISALCQVGLNREIRKSVVRGIERLLEMTKNGMEFEPSPIGLYFASLWYSEKLYPLVWTVEALGRAESAFRSNDLWH